MKKLSILLFLGLLLSFFSCEKEFVNEVETDVNITFKANYDGEQFYTMKDYEYQDGKAIRFNNFNFFISNLSLIRTESNYTGDQTIVEELIEIDNIDLSFTEEQSSQATAGKARTIKNILVGKYDKVRIGFGVNPELNRTSPAEYGAGHPLTAHYWDGWSSYIFSTIEGYADMNDDGEITVGGSDTEGFTYHSGTDEVYVEFNFGNGLELIENEEKDITINIDVKKLFKYSKADKDTNNDGYLDIQDFSGTHSNEEGLPIAKEIMKNFKDAVNITQ